MMEQMDKLLDIKTYEHMKKLKQKPEEWASAHAVENTPAFLSIPTNWKTKWQNVRKFNGSRCLICLYHSPEDH